MWKSFLFFFFWKMSLHAYQHSYSTASKAHNLNYYHKSFNQLTTSLSVSRHSSWNKEYLHRLINFANNAEGLSKMIRIETSDIKISLSVMKTKISFLAFYGFSAFSLPIIYFLSVPYCLWIIIYFNSTMQKKKKALKVMFIELGLPPTIVYALSPG